MRTIPLLAVLTLVGCGSVFNESAPHVDLPKPKVDLDESSSGDSSNRELVLAGGCFWCTEAVFEELKGVHSVVSGYAGGSKDNADYRTVSRGRTRHAEAIQITYDPKIISYGTLLRVFFSVAHDPTQKNRQGPDVGTQYRSAIFYANDEQKKVAQAYIKQLDESKAFDKPIATALVPFKAFYRGEDKHQDYVKRNPNDRYVRKYSLPKVKKLREVFPDLVRDR